MIKQSDIRKIFPKRKKLSHKGDHGKLLIIGGSKDFYGAPVLAGFGALSAGVDLVEILVPEINFQVTRGFAADFIVHSYPGNFLSENVVSQVSSLAGDANAVLIGPGLADREETIETVKKILKNLQVPTVVDAEGLLALQSFSHFPVSYPLVITPHHHEFEVLIGKAFPMTMQEEQKLRILKGLATDLEINILLKGAEDLIVSAKGEASKNVTGNPGMTVGGSGDVLAGIVAGFLAQKVEAADACKLGAYLLGKTGDSLQDQKGFSFTATDLAKHFPLMVKEFVDIL